MESHVLQYAPNYSITIQVNDLGANSFISFVDSGITKVYEAKGIFVGKVSGVADTNYALVQKDGAGKIINSSARTLPNQLPFSYFANTTTDLTFMEAVDKKMLNGLMGMIWDVYTFKPDGTYVEPVEFALSNPGVGEIKIDQLCGFSYDDLQYSYSVDDGSTWGSWVIFDTSSALISGLDSSTYTFKIDSSTQDINHIPEHTISI